MTNRLDWNAVWARLRELASYKSLWRADQDASLLWIAKQLEQQPGVLIADEVGLGKTRLAIALAICVTACGGRVAFLIPPGLTFQWRDEELHAFQRQLDALSLDWIPRDVSVKVLRTYPDLFNNGNRALVYPLSAQAPFVFISHRFGLPHGLSSLKRDELWGLPFALKLKLLKDGRLVRNAKWLELSEGQGAAVDWLAEHAPDELRARVTGDVLTKVSTITFEEPRAIALFCNLVGELIGDFDLVVIDEAHKSRAGTQTLNLSEKQAMTRLQSRLTLCLKEIILRPGSATYQAKRLALTATPMEMDVKQWCDVFQRLGLGDADIARLKTTAQRFADTIAGMHIGSESEVARLCTASTDFQDALQKIVTRRIWRDHPTVKRFAPYARQPGAAHPHRRAITTIVALEDLASDERLQLAYAEALASASRGIATQVAAKSAGSRQAQAMPLVSELALDISTPPALRAGELLDEATRAAEHAKRQRQAYWLETLHSLSRKMGPVADKPLWALQWHPKVRHVVTLIEELVARNGKVLVFAEFVEPMRALDRALNIRHYLRQVRDRKPALLPAGLKPDDPDMHRWLRSHDLQFSAERIGSFEADTAELAVRYNSNRAALRDACQSAANSFFAAQRPRSVVVAPESMDVLVTWLVQQLCVDEQYSAIDAQGGRSQIHGIAIELLRDLQDSDPAGKTDNDEAQAGRPFNWENVIRDQEQDLEKDLSGHYVFRMSPFSQRLYGDTKPSTRRVRQSAFNNKQLHPRVLIGQSAVVSEGLNLHRACHAVVLFHLDWNPGRIEQQIGRVDRQDSAWMAAFDEWEQSGRVGEPPYIEVHTVALAGTYDAFRTEVVNGRAQVLRSQLFGEILPPELLQRLPEDARAAIGRIEIDFRPTAQRA